jgi:hypothetical protein
MNTQTYACLTDDLFMLKLWKEFSQLKHFLRTIYLANWKMSSGQNEDDAMLTCAKHHWCAKKNKTIKTDNNKRSNSNPPQPLRPYYMLVDAPVNVAQANKLYPEGILFLLVREDPILVQGRKRKSPALTNAASSPGHSPSEKDDEEEDEEERMREGMTIKGSFASRRKQKQQNKRSKRRVLTAQKNQAAINQEKAALIHASAVKKHADSKLAETKLAAIESARKLGMNNSLLQVYLKETLSTLFGAEIPQTNSGTTGGETAARLEAAEQLRMMSAGAGPLAVEEQVSGSEEDD